MRAHLVVAVLIIGIIVVPMLPQAHAATGTYFDNIVVIAMENRAYTEVIGNSNAPFINSLIPVSATLQHYNSYGAAGRSVNGCSAGCYTALVSGSDQGISDGYGCCISATTLMDSMGSAGLTWQAYCESGCPRGNDHFPFTGFANTASSPNVFTGSNVSPSDLITAASSASPPNLLWYTPTDNNNMHDGSVSTGDSYIQNFLVGSGSLSSPAPGSLFASSLFQPGHRTLLMLWWDECAKGAFGCDSNNSTPNLWFGPLAGIKAGYSSTSTAYDEYSILHLIENNWALPTLATYDAAAAPMTEIFGSSAPLPLATSFLFNPSSPAVNTPVTFTASATGGTPPYTFSWSFGDGTTGAGSTVTHAYTTAGTYSVIETVADAAVHTATSTLSVTVTPPQPLSATFTLSPAQPTNETTATFTATVTGGTAPYSFAWSFGDGGSGTTNPATHVYAVSGTFTASLMVTDATAATFTTSKSITVIQSVKSGAFPYVRAWDGILPTESTADLQATFTLLQQRGYNAARISLVDPVLGVSTFNKPAFDNLLSIAKQHNIWLIMDDHEYGITDEAAWLSFWSPIITGYKNEPMIIWQPRNEPSNSAAQLSTFYQDWITQDRNLGDNHWIIVSISYGQFGAPNDSTFLSAFPTVTDPLQQVAYDFHDYYFYQYHPAWSISDAQAYAANVPAAVLSLEAFKNAPAIVSEFGADSSGGGPLPPDVIHSGCSCQYSPESLAYVVAVIQGLDNIKGSYGLWEAGNWDGSGMATGAMNIWGQLIPTPAPVPLSTSFTLLPSTPIINSPVTFAATTTGGTAPYAISWNFGDGSTSTGTTASHTYTTAQSFTVTETATDSSSPSQTATSSNTVTVRTPPPPSTSFTILPARPVVNIPVTFTAATTGGTAPYTINWNFGDGTIGTGASITHVYSTAQSFSVTETAIDSSSPSQNAVSSKTITVSAPPPPSTSFTLLPASPIVNTPVTFTATTIGGTPPYSVTWNFGDGTSGTGTSVTHAFASAQSFTVTETATDSSTPSQTATSSQPVTVVPIPPLSTTLQVSSSSPRVGQTITFTASAIGGTSPYSYTIAFGDGGTGTGNPVTHTYSAPGSYTATITVTDSASPQARIAASVLVNVQVLISPTLTSPGNQTVIAGVWINFTITAASLNIGGTLTLSATGLPSGASFNQATGVFSWKPSSSQTGSYAIIFTATDSSYPSTPTSRPMEIQVNQAAPGGPGGGNGGSGGSSNGSCTLCGIFPRISTNIGLLLAGGFLGLLSSLVVLTIKARASLERTKRRMGI